MKTTAAVLGICLLWGVAMVLVLLLAASAIHSARGEGVGVDRTSYKETRDGWSTSVISSDGAISSCVTTKLITHAVIAEFEYDKEAPVIRITGARFHQDTNSRSLVAVDGAKPMPVLAVSGGHSGWSTSFHLPSSKELWRQVRSGSKMVLVVGNRKIELPLKGSADALDSLESCLKNGQEFLDRRLVETAKEAPTL